MPILRVTIPVSDTLLAAVLHIPERAGLFPCLVTAHGLGSSKDSDKYVLIAEEFSRAGIAVCRFDFRGCGESGGTFAETTVSEEVADARAVVEAMRRHPALDGRIVLLGSSMGAYVSLYVAQQDPAILAIAAWACPADLDDLVEKPETVYEYGLGEPCLAEFRAGQYRRAPAGVANCLFIHGDVDEVVPVGHAHRLYAEARDPKRLITLPGADHRLSDPAHRLQAARVSLEWIQKYL
ncbi:MAG TPA: alpha/beta fold hydrolase [Candidatus Sulfotelmatobacter sp.]|nr:alpha/beta fold hydrolase [Candidatus Sulfotelmatobacter sp.]